MAEIIERKKKDGTFSYMIRVYSGRTRDDKVITKCKTVTPPTGMGKKKTEKWVQEQAILFEQKVTNGLVLDSDVLLDALSDAPPQYSLIVQLALLIGARRGEICALRWSDTDLEKAPSPSTERYSSSRERALYSILPRQSVPDGASGSARTVWSCCGSISAIRRQSASESVQHGYARSRWKMAKW